jgi:hypothetical protein
MSIYNVVLTILVIVSASANIYLFYRLKNSPKKVGTVKKDLAILDDLIGHEKCLIEIRRVAPTSFFLRSPRDL